MAGHKKSSTQSKNGKYPAQFRRTTQRTGKWRGKQTDEYRKYVKIKKQPQPDHRFDLWRGYVSIKINGEDEYMLVGDGKKKKLILTKIYKRNKKRLK